MRRFVPQIRTDLEFAPIYRDRLATELGGLACFRETDCRLQNCFTDRHHTVYGGDLTQAELLAKQHPQFIIDGICRYRHEQIHVTWNRSHPLTDEQVIGVFQAAPVQLSRRQRQRLTALEKTHDRRR